MHHLIGTLAPGGKRLSILDGVISAPSDVSVFGLASFDPTAQSGWPAGATVTRVKSQGALANGYWRGHGHKATRTNELDIYARGAKGSDSLVLETSAGDVTVNLTVADGTSGTIRYLDDELGSDANDGQSAGSGGAWKTWAYACTNAPASSTVIVKGRTTGGAQQVYDVPLAVGAQSTVVNDNVTFKADPDDVEAGTKPAVWVRGDEVKQYRITGGSNWSVHDATNNVYVSSGTVTLDTTDELLTAFYKAPNGRWVRMFYYLIGGVTQLSARGAGAQTDGGQLYCGPGIARDASGYIYISLDKFRDARVYADNTLGHASSDPDDWDMTAETGTGWFHPVGTDPDNVETIITGTHGGWQENGADHLGGPTNGDASAYTTLCTVDGRTDPVFQNIEFIGGAVGIDANATTSGFTAKGCDFWQAAPDIRRDAGVSYACYHVSTDGSSNLFDRCLFNGGAGPWVSWADIKSRHQEGGTMRAACWAGTNTTTMRNCTLFGHAQLRWGDYANMTLHNCIIEVCATDGGLVGGPNDTLDPQMRFVRNVWRAYTIFGPTYAASFKDALNANTCWFAYNVFVHSYYDMFVAGDLELDNGSEYSQSAYGNGDGRFIHRPIIAHGKISADDPSRGGMGKQYYYNTCIGGESGQSDYYAAAMMGDRNGWQGWGNGQGRSKGYNNIATVYDKGGEIHGTGAYALAALLDTHVADSFFDGNHYYVDPGISGISTVGIAAVWWQQDNTNNSVAFAADLAALRSLTGNHSQAQTYEANGTEGDPGFVSVPTWPEPYDISTYMLDTGSVCRTGAVDISGETWAEDIDANATVTLKHRPHRGALDPDVPLIEQEIGPL